MELKLSSAIWLTQACGLPPELAQQFTDVRDCGAAFQKYFMDAWKVTKPTLCKKHQLVFHLLATNNFCPQRKAQPIEADSENLFVFSIYDSLHGYR